VRGGSSIGESPRARSPCSKSGGLCHSIAASQRGMPRDRSAMPCLTGRIFHQFSQTQVLFADVIDGLLVSVVVAGSAAP
jgi:hypothetical protein